MEVKLGFYEHESNGINLQLMPETEMENELLRALLSHGRIESGHPCGAKFGTGFYVKAFGVKRDDARGLES